MLSVPPIFHVGVYGDEIHEMSETAAVPFGQYAHSNQPSHHLLYLFPSVGRPDRLQSWVRRVMNEMYSPEGFAGDEDTGSMAAWYVLSALGFYQVCPGIPEYTLGSPLFSKATVHLPGGCPAARLSSWKPRETARETVYVQAASFNGRPRTGRPLTHEELMAGGTLRFEMTSRAPSIP